MTMPFANEHSARLRDPDDFDADSFRRTNGGKLYGGNLTVPETIGVIWGKLKGKAAPDDPVLPQALRFPTKKWTATEAKGWLKENEVKYISFEPASGESDAQTMTAIERRMLPACEMRIVEGKEGELPHIVGYAAVFNQRSEVLCGFVEQIRPGAFARAIAEKQDVRALVNHSSEAVIGRTKNGTLTLKEDERGLLADIMPSQTSAGKDIVESIRRGDIDGMSFSFRVPAGGDEWTRGGNEGEPDLRTLIDVDLFDVSPVTFPAYTATSVGLRAEDTAVAQRSHEAWQKASKPADAGLLRRMLMRLRLIESA